jgi:hypothetical protein
MFVELLLHSFSSRTASLRKRIKSPILNVGSPSQPMLSSAAEVQLQFSVLAVPELESSRVERSSSVLFAITTAQALPRAILARLVAWLKLTWMRGPSVVRRYTARTTAGAAAGATLTRKEAVVTAVSGPATAVTVQLKR